MPKGTPNFEDIATEVIDALTAGGWEHTGTARAGFWSVSQMGQGKDLVDVFTPAGQRQDRVWLSPAKGGKRAETRALEAIEAGGFKAAERRQKGLRIVRARGRRNAPVRRFPPSPTFLKTVKMAREKMDQGWPIGSAIQWARKRTLDAGGYPANYQAVYARLEPARKNPARGEWMKFGAHYYYRDTETGETLAPGVEDTRRSYGNTSKGTRYEVELHGEGERFEGLREAKAAAVDNRYQLAGWNPPRRGRRNPVRQKWRREGQGYDLDGHAGILPYKPTAFGIINAWSRRYEEDHGRPVPPGTKYLLSYSTKPGGWHGVTAYPSLDAAKKAGEGLVADAWRIDTWKAWGGRKNPPRRARRNGDRHGLIDVVGYLAILERGEGPAFGLRDTEGEIPELWNDPEGWREYVARDWANEWGDPYPAALALVRRGSWSHGPSQEPDGPLEVLYSEVLQIPYRMDRGGAYRAQGIELWDQATRKAKAAPWGRSNPRARKGGRLHAQGDLAEFTGETETKYGATWHLFRRLDGHRKGEVGVTDLEAGDAWDPETREKWTANPPRRARRNPGRRNAPYKAGDRVLVHRYGWAGTILGPYLAAPPGWGNAYVMERDDGDTIAVTDKDIEPEKLARVIKIKGNPGRLNGARRNPGPTLTAASRRAPPAIRRK